MVGLALSAFRIAHPDVALIVELGAIHWGVLTFAVDTFISCAGVAVIAVGIIHATTLELVGAHINDGIDTVRVSCIW